MPTEELFKANKTMQRVLEFEVDDVSRKANIRVPIKATQNDLPVLFYFHGAWGSADTAEANYPFHQFWPDAIIVYAEGLPYNPPDEQRKAWRIRFPHVATHCGEVSDLNYINEIIRELQTTYTIDNDRIFATGGSSGGFFTLSLMELMPDVFRAFAPFACYAKFKVNLGIVDCNIAHGRNAHELPFPAPFRQGAVPIPRPVLYFFGMREIFDLDGPVQIPSWCSDSRVETRFTSTVKQLMIRNGVIPPPISEWFDVTERQVFTPFNSWPIDNGAEVHIQLHSGRHSFAEYPYGNGIEDVIQYFKSF